VLDSTTLYLYFGVFIALVAAGVGFPIPEEIPVVTAGALVGHQDSHVLWWIMLPLCIAGVVISDALLYGIGRLWGPRLLEYRWIKSRLLPLERRDKIESNFRRYGVKILLGARLLPAIRSPIFITAGIMRVPFSHFLLADGIYAIPGVSLLFFLGCWFTDQFMDAVKKAESYRPLVIVIVLVAVASYLVYHFMSRPVATGDPKELPVIARELPVIARQVAAKLSHADLKAPVIHGDSGISADGATSRSAADNNQLESEAMKPPGS
jgi:membrane protein DedA with SNARE-associated domain